MDLHSQNEWDAIGYDPRFDEYTMASGDQRQALFYCPFCGGRLPQSKRDRWFDELEALGITDPWDGEVPAAYRSDAWWKQSLVGDEGAPEASRRDGTRPIVIVLNGVGSVGKSSTAKALQGLAREPLLHVSMDAFLEMLPASMFGHPDGYIFETIFEDGKPSVAIHSGPVMAPLLSGMRHAVAAMAAQGLNIVVDDVMFSGGEAEEYRRLLGADCEVRLVGLFAPLEVLEQRERDRGDRVIGLARWQYGRVHEGIDYDLAIETAALTSDEVARTIQQAFGL